VSEQEGKNVADVLRGSNPKSEVRDPANSSGMQTAQSWRLISAWLSIRNGWPPCNFEFVFELIGCGWDGRSTCRASGASWRRLRLWRGGLLVGACEGIAKTYPQSALRKPEDTETRARHAVPCP